MRNQANALLENAVAEIENGDTARHKLKRELRKEALARIEKAARTQADFELLINIWDKDDKSRKRKDERYFVDNIYETKTDVNTGDIENLDEIICTDTVFPTPFRFTLRTRYWRQVIAGNFLDYIFDCKANLHEMTSRADLSKALQSLTENQKDILYMVAIEGRTPQEIASYRGQTARNIRKVYAGAIKSILRRLEK